MITILLVSHGTHHATAMLDTARMILGPRIRPLAVGLTADKPGPARG